jgi:outer membrane protein assembly factor BamB
MIRLAAGVLVLVVAGCSGSTPARNDGAPRDAQSDAVASQDAHDAHDGGGSARDGAPEVGSQGGGAAVAFQVDIAHTGNQTASTLTPPLTRAWSVDFGDSNLRALDLVTGQPLWGPVNIGGVDQWSNAAYDDGRLYVVISSGLVTAFDAATGAMIWSKKMPGQNDFSAPPTAAGGMVYLGGAGLDGTVYGVDGKTGTVIWSAPTAGGDVSSPALSADTVFVSYACVQAYAFSRTDGTQIWHHEGTCVGAGGATPALWQGAVWARDSASSNLVLDATSGAELGSFSATVIPAFADQRGFFLTGGTLQALEVTTRTILWSFAGDGALASAPLVVNGVVYIGSTSGQLYGLDPTTGTMLWLDTLPWGISPSGEFGLAPVAGLEAGGNALVVPAGNHLVCYR